MGSSTHHQPQVMEADPNPVHQVSAPASWAGLEAAVVPAPGRQVPLDAASVDVGWNLALPGAGEVPHDLHPVSCGPADRRAGHTLDLEQVIGVYILAAIMAVAVHLHDLYSQVRGGYGPERRG